MMPPLYVPGDSTQATFALKHWAVFGVVRVFMAGSVLAVPRQAVTSVAWHGLMSPLSGSGRSGREFSIGSGLILAAVPLEASPPSRIVAPLSMVIWNAEFAAFAAPFWLVDRVHVELTKIEPS